MPSDAIRKFIKEREGCRLKAYLPTPKDRWTIGYGSTFKLDGTPIKEGDTITQQEADELFELSLTPYAIMVSGLCPDNCTQQQFDAVLSLCYNVGVYQFEYSTTGKMFSSAMDISDRFKLWDKQKGKTLPGLTKRRLAEQRIYKEGVYS